MLMGARRISVSFDDVHYTDPAVPIPLPLDGARQPLTIADGSRKVERSVLPGGVRVISEAVPTALSASVGIWFEVGSRDETGAEGGVSHFLEHLLFKGTATRDALQIAEAFDRVGAESNAATSKEFTYYWSHMVAADLPVLLPVLMDMVTSSLIADEAVDVERTVILDELAMSDDTPTDVAAETFARAVYGGGPLGRPVGGTAPTVEAITAETIRGRYQARYNAPRMVVAAAGAVSHSELCDLVLQGAQQAGWLDDPERAPAPRRPRTDADPFTPLGLDPGGMISRDETWQRDLVVNRDVEQAHIIVGGPWLSVQHRLAPVSSVTLTLLGGSMSSRLFQEIRERRGLAYSTFAYSSAYADAGNFALYAGTAPKNLEQVETLLWGEVERLAQDGPMEDELDRIKGQSRGALTLDLENMGSRMVRLARAELGGRYVTVDDVLERIDRVSGEDVQLLSALMLEAPRASAVVTDRG